MKYLYLATLLFCVLTAFGQTPPKKLLSAILINPDTVVLPDVTIINARTGYSVRTNAFGFFQVEIEEGDSLITNHISYQKRVITENDNGKHVLLIPAVQMLDQVDVSNTDPTTKHFQEMSYQIKQAAAQKKPDGYEKKKRQNYFYEQHGSHNRGFGSFFGPTATISLEKITNLFKRKKR